MANNGPSLTKATYDKKHRRKTAPSPARSKVALEEKMWDAEKSRKVARKVTKVGLAQALFPAAFPPKKPIRRI